MKKLNIIFSFFLLFFLFINFALACIVGVASGKATIDGRPLLWKNRDSSGFENYVQYFIGDGYNFLGFSLNYESENI